MTYVTGQPIVFVGCGQVSANHRLNSRCSLMTGSLLDLHRPETVESRERCGSDTERLIRRDFITAFETPLPEMLWENHRRSRYE